MALPLWIPPKERIEKSRLLAFSRFVKQQNGPWLETFDDIYHWSISEPGAFWLAVKEFTGLIFSRSETSVLVDEDQFPGAGWFPGAQLNFAENLLRYRDDQIAIVSVLENGEREELSYETLYVRTAQVASAMRKQGIVSGDRVVGFMPNITETIIVMLATSSIGAIWSSCSPDFGINGVLDRFGQIEPKLLITTDGYFYNNKTCDSLERAREISNRLESLESVVVVPLINKKPDIDQIDNAVLFKDFLDTDAMTIEFQQSDFGHPLYIMYSSGTTGAPKCIVHGVGGTLIQHMKEHQLHVGLRREDKFFYFTTCGWMMWNWLVTGLATGATLVLYDGSPFAADGEVLLDLMEEEQITIFGTSAKYLSALEKAGKKPNRSHNFENLTTILSTGSPLSSQSYDFVYKDIKADVCLSSISGGTDIVSCFVCGSETRPVYRGEIQVAGLGMAVEIWNEEGASVVQEKGELVCTQPFPCAPLGFWNDKDGSRYRQAYFDRWPRIWAQGDYGEVTAQGGYIIHGRSDAVLNPGGVRIGTAEIYRQVERLDEVIESIVIGQQWQDDVRVVLFVVLRESVILDTALQQKIRAVIRRNTTPRHVPAKIIAVPDIPRTLSGKIVELAVRRVVHGDTVDNADALANPEALDYYRDLPELDN